MISNHQREYEKYVHLNSLFVRNLHLNLYSWPIGIQCFLALSLSRIGPFFAKRLMCKILNHNGQVSMELSEYGDEKIRAVMETVCDRYNYLFYEVGTLLTEVRKSGS